MDPSMILTEHGSPVSALDFNQTTLVSGCEDGTMIHWDLETGKSLSLMDTVWNMNTGLVKDFKSKYSKVTNGRGSDYDSLNSTIGSLMVWKHALASGTIDGVIRMWDIRTGQSHRSLSDHLGPITSLQFDQTTIVSSSLDKTIRIWDLRMGKVVEKLSLNHPVLKVQFDKQMIVGIVDEYELPYVYNRVTFQPQQLEVPSLPVTVIDESEAFIAKMNGTDPIKESGPTRYFSSKFTRSSPMGSVGWLASGTRSGSVNIWSI
jgi:division protein 1